MADNHDRVIVNALNLPVCLGGHRAGVGILAVWGNQHDWIAIHRFHRVKQSVHHLGKLIQVIGIVLSCDTRLARA